MSPALSRAISFVGKHWAMLVCCALLVVFAALSWFAVREKSPTGDEPLHATGAFVKRFHADFRVDPEDPPLFGYWAMLPHTRHALATDRTAPYFLQMTSYMWRQWEWVIQTLFRTPGNDADRFINRSRAMMLVLGVAGGAVIALWARQLAGAVAAVAATALFALDPNFLAHAPLVKNDVPLALLMLALAHAAWRAGERVTLPRALAIGLLLGAAVNTKFSGVLLGPMLVLVLVTRALVARPWIVLGRLVTSRARRLVVSVGLIAWAALAGAGVTWLCYGLRYAPTPDPELRLPMALIVKAATRNEMITRNPLLPPPTDEQIQAQPPSLLTRAVVLLDRYELLPHAWLAGFLDTYATTLVRRSYLLGEVGSTGWWYYFPLAIVFKTPLATLAAALGAVLVTLVLRMRRGTLGIDPWAAVCVAVPMLVYGWSLLATNLNLGIRHALAVYPIAYILIGVVIARLWRSAPRATAAVSLMLLVGLSIETIRAYPHYIPFFNAAFESRRLQLLGDSNLDWGQDLKLLARWRREHSDVRLYFLHFGGVDPRYYVPGHIPLRGTNPPDLPNQQQPDAPGVIAVSATHLQGIYLDPQTAFFYQDLLRRQPDAEVLGGSIYLFKWR